MQVCTGGISGASGFANSLSGAYRLIHLHQPLFEVGIYRFKVMVMAEDDEFPIALLESRKDNPSLRGGAHRGSFGHGNINAFMFSRSQGARFIEFGRYFGLGGSHRPAIGNGTFRKPHGRFAAFMGAPGNTCHRAGETTRGEQVKAGYGGERLNG